MLRLRGSLVLLRSRLVLLRLRSHLTLLRLRCCLTLLRRRLTLLRSHLMLLLWCHLALLLLLWRRLMFLRGRLMLLLLLRRRLMLLLLRCRLVLLLLLLHSPIGFLERRRWFHVAIGREWLADRHIGRASMICIGELGPVGARRTLILHLGRHRCSVRLMHGRQFRRPRRRPDASRSAVITYAGVVRVVGHRTTINVVHHGDVHVIDRAVVVEMAAAPVTALVAVSYVAIAVVDAAIVADVLAPVARVKPVGRYSRSPSSRGSRVRPRREPQSMHRVPSSSRPETRPSSRESRYSRRREPAVGRTRAKVEAAGLKCIQAVRRNLDRKTTDPAEHSAGRLEQLSCLERGPDWRSPGPCPGPACPPDCYPPAPGLDCCGNRLRRV